MIPLVLFPYLLAGFWSWKLTLILFASLEVGYFITLLLWLLLRKSPKSEWVSQAYLSGGEFGVKHPYLTIGFMGLFTVIIIVYIVISGITHFKLPSGSTELITHIFQYTFLWLIVSSFFSSIYVLPFSLMSLNLDPDTRTRFIVTRLGDLITNALYFSLIFWSFGIFGKGINLEISNISLEFSPRIIILVIIYFSITALIPYVIGTKRGKKKAINLMEKSYNQLDELVKIFEDPEPSSFDPNLKKLYNDLTKEINDFLNADSMVKTSYLIDNNLPLPQEYSPLKDAYITSRLLDPRFRYYDWLKDFEKNMSLLIKECAERTSELDKQQSATHWLTAYKTKRDDLRKEIEKEEKTNPRALIVTSCIVTFLTSIILSKLSDFIWNAVQSLIKS
jgi:hypothetical protein